MYCHNIVVDGERIHIPGCDGCACMGDHDYCTCDYRKRKKTYEEKVNSLMSRVLKLEKRMKTLAQEPSDAHD